MELRGTVRFRFRSPEHDVDVLLEGDAGWVNGIREELRSVERRLGKEGSSRWSPYNQKKKPHR